MDSLTRFLTPLSYLRIQRDGKYVDELFIPIILTLMTFLVFFLTSWKVPVFGASGLVVSVTSYLQVVSGFYIASLAAIATFNKETMDKTMAGDPPTLKVRVKGVVRLEELSRRRFLCFLFGYLALLSIILYFVGIGSNLLAPVISLNNYYLALGVKWGFAAIYTFASYNMICTTLLGLYYMADRIHRKDNEFTDSEKTSTKEKA